MDVQFANYAKKIMLIMINKYSVGDFNVSRL